MSGSTESYDFPVLNAFQDTLYDDEDGILMKLDASGTMIWSTYFGADDDDEINGVSIDSEGRVYVAGNTDSEEFYTTPGAFQDSIAGEIACFAARFSPDGEVIWSTYFGGNDEENGNDIIVDQNDDIIIIGEAYSVDCPITPGFYQDSIAGSDDFLLIKMDSSGNLIYATVLCGTSDDDGRKVGMDHEDNIYIIGDVTSTDFPTTPGAFQSTKGGDHEAVITKYDQSGSLIWSSYLGGDSSEYVYGIAVDYEGIVYVLGETGSTDFPVTANAHQSTKGFDDDMFISTFDSVGNVIWSTYYGGNADDDAAELRFHNHKLYVLGQVESTDLDITSDALQSTLAGEEDVYIAIFQYVHFHTGVESPERIEMKIHPNPAYGEVVISIPPGTREFTITDLSGKVLWEIQAPSSERLTINTESWQSGVYLVKADSQVRKLVVQ